MKLGLFTDTHYCELEELEQTRHPRRAYEAVNHAYEDFRKNNVDVAVCLGDLIHYNNGIDESIEHLKKISSLINSYKIPTYICIGNHDNEVLGAVDYEKISGLKTAPCVYDSGDIRLVFLDASYTPEGEPYKREHVDWTKSYVPVNQLEWLDCQLNTEKKCLIFIHQNIDTNVEEHHIVSNAAEINSVIQNHNNVLHVFQGHYHYGAENIIGKIPYTTIRAMCIGDETNYKIVEF